MGRSGYADDCDDQWLTIRWRGAVTSAMRGKNGQIFLKEMLTALDALPEKKLVRHVLQDTYESGAVCVLGAVGRKRDLNMSLVDPEDNEHVASLFGIPHALACELMYMNDEMWWRQTPEQRFDKMRKWIASQVHVDLNEVSRWEDDGGRCP